jgi:hypothetical protein
MARNDGAPAACTSAMIGAISAALAAAIAATASLPRRRAARVSFAFLRYPPSFTPSRLAAAKASLVRGLAGSGRCGSIQFPSRGPCLAMGYWHFSDVFARRERHAALGAPAV